MKPSEKLKSVLIEAGYNTLLKLYHRKIDQKRRLSKLKV